MATAVYVLCAMTSFGCSGLLLRNYWRTSIGLLLWCGLCFLGFAVNNVLLIVDLVVFPEVDYSVPRNLVMAVSVSLLLYGLLRKDGIRIPKGEG